MTIDPDVLAWRRLPGSTRMAIHPGSGRNGRGLRSLTGASDWRRQLVDRAGFAALAALGATALASAPPLPWPAATHDQLDTALRDALPGLQAIGAVLPRQRGRQRLSLLARMTGTVVIVKLGADDDRLDRERRSLELLTVRPLPGIATPAPIDSGSLRIGEASVTFLVTTSIALRHQTPAFDVPLRTFSSDLADRLGALPRIGDEPRGNLVPVHGDLTPWNLRRTPSGLALFDWEGAGWGRPGSDLALYRRTCDQVRPWWSRTRTASNSGEAR